MIIFLILIAWAVIGLLALMDRTMRSECVKSAKLLAILLAILLGPFSYVIFDIVIKSEEDQL